MGLSIEPREESTMTAVGYSSDVVVDMTLLILLIGLVLPTMPPPWPSCVSALLLLLLLKMILDCVEPLDLTENE
jgi:hypothetical protein